METTSQNAPRASTSMPPAVVVGLCLHGLATVRALARKGIRTHALEDNPDLPGTRTRHATVHIVPDINGEGLIDALVGLREKISKQEKPVLFLMNDNMVLLVARKWSFLKDYYRLSWASSIDQVLHLLIKSNLEAYCSARKLDYPESWVLNSADDLEKHLKRIPFPVVVKPAKPLGGFKVAIISDADELATLVNSHQEDYPLLIQQWIAGDDTHLYMCALYLDEGRELARFCGRKLLSNPPALGRTTAAESIDDDSIYEFTRIFFEGLRISGPVSLELKKDDTGRIWVIEPTLGRTDFWLGLCIAGNVDFPYIEYCSVNQLPAEKQKKRKAYWFDTEVDPAGYIRLMWPRWLRGEHGKVMLPYLDPGDIRPFFLGMKKLAARKIRA